VIEEIKDWVAFFLIGHKYPEPVRKWATDRVINWICREASEEFITNG
jgi:hypothetical protein